MTDGWFDRPNETPWPMWQQTKDDGKPSLGEWEMKIPVAVLLSVLAASAVGANLPESLDQVPHELNEAQIAAGCKQTRPDCVRVSGSRFTEERANSRYEEYVYFVGVTARNRCRQKVLLKVCFEETKQHDSLDNCEFTVLDERENKNIRTETLTEEYVRSEEDAARRHGGYPPWSEFGAVGWATGRVSFAWIGVPDDYALSDEELRWERAKLFMCQTMKFEDIEYEYK